MLTPVEIRHVKLGRRALGYHPATVDGVLEEIRASFEVVWRERADFREEIERLEAELARYRELEVLLRNSLVSAERAADELRVQARKEADVMLEEARVRAREIAGDASDERERVKADVRRLTTLGAEIKSGYRAFLLGALDRLEGETADGERTVPAPPRADPGEAPEPAL